MDPRDGVDTQLSKTPSYSWTKLKLVRQTHSTQQRANANDSVQERPHWERARRACPQRHDATCIAGRRLQIRQAPRAPQKDRRGLCEFPADRQFPGHKQRCSLPGGTICLVNRFPRQAPHISRPAKLRYKRFQPTLVANVRFPILQQRDVSARVPAVVHAGDRNQGGVLFTAGVRAGDPFQSPSNLGRETSCWLLPVD